MDATCVPRCCGRDRVYAAGFRHDLAGRAEMHSLELDFPAGAARENRAVLILNGWIDWADGSTFMAAVARRAAGLSCRTCR